MRHAQDRRRDHRAVEVKGRPVRGHVRWVPPARNAECRRSGEEERFFDSEFCTECPYPPISLHDGGMSSVGITEARDSLEAIIDSARDEPVYLTRHNRTVVVVEIQRLRDLARDAEDAAAAAARRERRRKHFPYPERR